MTRRIEDSIAQVMKDKASALTVSDRISPRVVRRARVRRMAFLSYAVLGTVAVMMGGALVLGAVEIGAGRRIEPSRGAGEPEIDSGPTGASTDAVAAGARQGTQWELRVFEDSDGAECLAFVVSDRAGLVASCIAGNSAAGLDPGYDPTGLSVLSERLSADTVALYGEGGSDIHRVTVTLETGGTVEAATVPPPDGVTDRDRFFVMFVPVDSSGSLQALNPSGQVVSERGFELKGDVLHQLLPELP